MGTKKTRPRVRTLSPENVIILVSFALILSHLAVASAAIHRSALLGLERYFSLFAALSTSSRKFLHRTSGPTAFLSFPGLAAGEATLRFVGVSFLLKKLLFCSGERKLFAAIAAHDLLVGKTH